ncbi:MAG: hypothetical protein AAGA28_18675 [Pseudomonadota bacterium]
MTDTVATLWIGHHLSWLERLSLKSFHDVGQTPVLYTYDEIEDVPDYVELRDARTVMDKRFTQCHWGKDRLDDPRIHSDIFRVMLMRRTDHIWVDADVYALRPHATTQGYLFAMRRRNFVPNSVIRTPRNSPATRMMEQFVSQTGTRPPWWSAQQIDLQERTVGDFSFEKLPVGVTGPEAFGYFLCQTGEARHATPFDVLNPVMARHSTTLIETPSPYDVTAMRENSMSLHLYASGARRRLIKPAMNGVAPEGSLLDHLCRTHGIDMAAHPITHRDSKQSARLRRQLYRAA